MTDLVPVAPLRDKFLELRARGETNGCQIALRLGWTRLVRQKNGRRYEAGDSSRVLRSLGLRGQMSRGQNIWRERIHADTAARLAEAMGLDPVDIGL